jgi:hypothetical protein
MIFLKSLVLSYDVVLVDDTIFQELGTCMTLETKFKE